MSNKRAAQVRFEFKQGARFGVSAEVAGEALASIRKKRGWLVAKDVVDESRPKDAALHPVFEWDDFEAAEKYRRNQARTIIRAVQVEEVVDGIAELTPVYVHVAQSQSDDDESQQSGYQPVSLVITRPDMFAQAVSELSKKVVSARESLEQLRRAAESSESPDSERMAKISIALIAMQTAGAAVAALH